jgi:hypothetical protein
MTKIVHRYNYSILSVTLYSRENLIVIEIFGPNDRDWHIMQPVMDGEVFRTPNENQFHKNCGILK